MRHCLSTPTSPAEPTISFQLLIMDFSLCFTFPCASTVISPGRCIYFVMNADTFVNKQMKRLLLRGLYDRTCTPTGRAEAVACVDLFKVCFRYRSAVICIDFMLHDCNK